MKSISKGSVDIKSIKLLGSSEEIKCTYKDSGLHIVAPERMPNEYALVYKIVLK